MIRDQTKKMNTEERTKAGSAGLIPIVGADEARFVREARPPQRLSRVPDEGSVVGRGFSRDKSDATAPGFSP